MYLEDNKYGGVGQLSSEMFIFSYPITRLSLLVEKFQTKGRSAPSTPIPDNNSNELDSRFDAFQRSQELLKLVLVFCVNDDLSGVRYRHPQSVNRVDAVSIYLRRRLHFYSIEKLIVCLAVCDRYLQTQLAICLVRPNICQLLFHTPSTRCSPQGGQGE